MKMEDDIHEAIKAVAEAKGNAENVVELAEKATTRNALLRSLVEQELVEVDNDDLITLECLSLVTVASAKRAQECASAAESVARTAMSQMTIFAVASEIGDMVAQGDAIKSFNEAIEATSKQTESTHFHAQHAVVTYASFRDEFPTFTIS